MTIREQLLNNSNLSLENNIFYQKNLHRTRAFEAEYIKIRTKENRVYPDEVVMQLPDIAASHTLHHEWQARKASLQKLMKILATQDRTSILELGCGNGWLSHYLAMLSNAEICALDVNETELLQGARVFHEYKNITFIYADIFTVVFPAEMFDTIVLAASIQYFPQIKVLMERLFPILKQDGEIYILDSPFYASSAEANAAKVRSENYFHNANAPGMASQYYHHTVKDLSDFKTSLLHNHKSIVSILGKKVLRKAVPVFPIIKLKK
jgi:ubiquinone/menaquinone biosynthesis C-methylase UbiE